MVPCGTALLRCTPVHPAVHNSGNITGGKRSLKLKAPLMEYVVRGMESLFPHSARGFVATVSFAKGGLANAWGAGLYRFSDEDLTSFPFSPLRATATGSFATCAGSRRKGIR